MWFLQTFMQVALADERMMERVREAADQQ